MPVVSPNGFSSGLALCSGQLLPCFTLWPDSPHFLPSPFGLKYNAASQIRFYLSSVGRLVQWHEGTWSAAQSLFPTQGGPPEFLIPLVWVRV